MVIIIDPLIMRQPTAEEFQQRLMGQTIMALERRGKYLIFQLSRGEVLILHLKMSGTLLLNPPRISYYARAIFYLDGNQRLVFVDPRKLGVMWLVKDKQAIVGKLGPEPLTPDFTPELLYQIVKQHKAPIKAVLCDQEYIAGIGNMYADEALFSAGIHPLRQANSLDSWEVKQLYKAIQEVLEAAISSKGASTDTYVRPNGELGRAHSAFRVAHRGGEPCSICGIPIKRTVLRGRGTYFCPNCQPLSRN